MKTKNILRIAVPLAIIIIVGGMYYLRSVEDASETGSDVATPLIVEEINVDELIAYELPIMLAFGGEECQPCKLMRPDLTKIHDELEGKASIVYGDIWAKPELAADYPITVVPSQVFFNADGTPYLPSEEIQQIIPGIKLYRDENTEELIYTVHEGMLSELEMNEIFEDMGVAV